MQHRDGLDGIVLEVFLSLDVILLYVRLGVPSRVVRKSGITTGIRTLHKTITLRCTLLKQTQVIHEHSCKSTPPLLVHISWRFST